MISYAQNGEDVVLARAFSGQGTGFYVDVGAGHPVFESVTKHFYEQGWSGINVEPLPQFVQLLEEQRTRDVNLGVGLADAAGEATLYEGDRTARGCSTFEAGAGIARAAVTHPVPMRTLASVCAEHVGDRAIDFLKVDVEGYERRVLVGADWARWRPRVLVIEATEPETAEPSFAEWEPIVEDAGYEFALFDGVNRFYARDDEPVLRARMGAPANVLDDYVPYQYAEFDAMLESSRRHARALEEALARAEAHLEEATAYARALEDARQRAETYAQSMESEIARLRATVADATGEPSG